ncbi:hypothetical protein [Streptomyces microflavus]|uniref:hypothetical protein n=1 Tax=Streptomyces microflavus TaxID=1919 RepID=UPI0036CFA03E
MPGIRTVELVRVVAVYECPACGNEFHLTAEEDFTGIAPQETDHYCPDEPEEDEPQS